MCVCERGGEGFSLVRAPPFPLEIFAAKVFDSLGSSEGWVDLWKQKKEKKKKKAWQTALPFVVVPHGANTKQPESKSQKTTPKFYNKIFFPKNILFIFSHLNLIIFKKIKKIKN